MDLLNTLEVHEDGDTVDFLATAGGLSDWLDLESERLDGWAPVTGGDLLDFRAMRATIRELVGALLSGSEVSEDTVGAINAASARAPTYPELDCSRETGPRVHTVSAAPGAPTALAEMARSAIDLAGGSARELLRVCEAPGCPRIFVATNLRRRWCSEPCGNRARVARYYRRHH